MLRRWLIYVVVLISTPDVFPQVISRNKRSDDYINCEYDWFHFSGKCYRIGGALRSLNWYRSVEHCTSLGATLASVESKEENDFLISLLLLEIKKSAWIGLNDREKEGNYKWQSGSTSSYRNWMAHEPAGESRPEEDCVQLLVNLHTDSVGEWVDNPCNLALGYICEKKSDPNFRSPNLRYCTPAEGGGFRFLGSCYHLVTVRKSWEEAEQYCADSYGGHLITVLDKTVDFYLNYIFHSIQSEVWIGIKIRDRYQQKWISGWYVGYNGFDKDYREFVEGTCVARTQRKNWNIVKCSKKFSFICEKSIEKIPTLRPPVNGSYCPSIPHDWRDLDGEFCYFIETEKAVTWYEANFQCMLRGGNLLSIHSKEEEDILHPFIRFTNYGAFIGLFRQYGRENTFGWTDGSALNFENWSPFEPNNENEKCVEARENDMKWNDIDCDAKREYICAIKKILPNLTTASTEKPESDCECSVLPNLTTASTEKPESDCECSVLPNFTTASTEKPESDCECSVTPNITTDCIEKSGYDGDSSGSQLLKAIIGVAVSLVINVILLVIVIYNFRSRLVERKKSSPDVIDLQTTSPAAPHLNYRPTEIMNNEEP